ncbi:MAG: formimidoylglutamate deiminase [Alphaproteobacteria bacterium]
MQTLRTQDYFASTAFLPGGWASDVLITVDEAGWITKVQPRQSCGAATRLAGAVMPGMPNLHSHAFQRAMAGLAEGTTGEKDSFWTWRDVMYRFLEKLTVEDQQAIAAQLYVDMLKAGYTSVGEFHYLHHQPDGAPYEDRALASHHIVRAAQETGIAITHMPVFYACSGFGGQKPTSSQKRFINNEMEILDIISGLASAYQGDPQVTIGLAHHSLRAVTPPMLQDVTRVMHSSTPIHIHIAEQTKEVDDCIAWSGCRPVEWLLDNVDVGTHWCLVHATHMNESETRDLARSGAVAGLCPTTEANLGDGLFNLPDYMREGGRFGIGSDSHISVSMIEELRLLEYGQRLMRRERAVTKMPGQASTGAALYRAALAGGAQALGRSTGAIEAGKRADFIALDLDNPAFTGKREDFIFDTMIFASIVNPIRDVIAGGQHVVKNFRHKAEDEIAQTYKKTLERLLG